VSVSDGTTPTPPSAVTIGFTNVNNPPVLTTNTLSITEGQSVVLGSTNLNTTDSDTPATALTYSITGVTNGRFELVSNVGVAITSFTQAQINNGQVRFVHDGSENAPGYNVSVSDGTTPTPPSRVTISFTNVNDAPTLTGTKATLAAGKQDTVYTINQIDLLTGFTDAENDPLSVSNLTATNGTLVNNNNGTWSFTPAANYNGTINLIYNVTDGKGGIAPATQSFNLDAAPPSTISISNPNPQNEGNSGTVAHNFEVSLSNPSSQVIVVNYDTTDGSANFADADYNRSYGNLVFKPGETKKTITVTSNGDNRYEANETFNVNLSDPINATIAKATAIGTINNDDSFPGIAIADVSQNEGNSGTTNFNFAVTLSNPSYQTVSVNYATADGISVASKDYNSTSGVLTFNPGEITKNISVAVIGNTVAETNKNFLVNLSNPSNGTIVNNRGVGTIVNDDSSLVGTNTNKTGTQNGPTTFSATDFTAAGGTTPSKIKITTLPNNGTLQLGNSNVVQNQEIALTDISNLRFTPATGWNGTTNFTWKGFDGVAYSNTDATVNLTINRVNNPPFLNLPISTQTATTNSLFNFTFAADTFKDLDVGDILTYTATLPNGNPLPSWLFFNPIARTFVGTPTTSDAGNVTILLKATDSANASVNYPFNLNIANTLSPAPANSDIDCFCEQIIHPNVNNLPGVSSALNSTEQSQLDNDEDNSLFGTSSNDLLHGFGGNDLLLGREGDDNVLGGKGNDLTFGGEGRDWIGAGFGDDFANGNEGDDFVNGNEGNDTVRGGLGQDFVRGGQDNDILYGDRGNDTLGGDHGNDTLFGGSGDAPGNDERDLIFGGSGDDLLYGNTGNDSLFGEQGNDTIRAGKDHDIASGDAGDDVLFGDHGNDSLCGCDGNDTIFGGVGANGGDASPSDDDYICGGAGNDLLFGNQGADWINGEVGDDTIYGGQGNDTLIGRDGNDILSGDRGNDSLMGGNGSDKFVLAVGQGSDVIVDFQDGVDSLVLSGNLTFPQLSIVQSGNNTLISLTNNNELLATLNGISANLITAQDFLVALS
ncbi:Calx-beta domain-containing protein, partial [Aerosakkonemataceae cyanobacterium BLCC-F50]